MVFWADMPRASIFNLPRASTFVKSVLATTHMHSATFAPNLLSDLRAIAMFAFMQLPSIWAAFMLPLSSCCTHSVAPALRDTYGTALMPHHPEDDKWSLRAHEMESQWRVSEGQHWDLRQLPWHNVYMQKAAAQQNACTLLCGTVLHSKFLQCSKWVFSFCPKFSLIPSLEGNLRFDHLPLTKFEQKKK